MADKVIQVNVTSTKSQRVSVSPGNVQNEISATPDSSQYYSNLAKNWAIGAGLILNEDYSSKHYAKESANSASSAKNYADASQVTYTNVQNVANEALTDIETARVDAVDAVTTTKNNAVTEINKEVTDGKKELNDIIEAGGLNINDKLTNCLLEVPQNIKLELKDGVLTLKAGSKVIVPNGAGVFEEVTITQDINYPSLSHANADRVVFVNTSANTLNGYDNDWVFSGSTAPSPNGTTYAWYDTTNNIVKSTSNSGSTWTTGLSLPICIGNYIKDSGFTSIDQVFNGCGVIGLATFALPNVKVLIPNGRNADGTLNNIEHTINKVLVNANPGTGSRTLIYDKTNNNIFGRQHPTVFVQDTRPTIIITSTVQQWWFNPSENIMYRTMDAGATWNKAEGLFIGDYVLNTTYTNFNPKLPFRAVDYNEFAKSINTLSKAYITETYVSGKSGYRVWSDGYCEQWGRGAEGNTAVTFLKPFKNTNYLVNVTAQTNSTSDTSTFASAVINPTTTGITIRTRWCSSANTGNATCFSWQACGYIS